MIDFTKFFRFKKPDKNEFYNVVLNNENLDSIDEALAKISAQLLKKAAIESPNFTGIPKIAGKEIPTIESGTWTPILYGTISAGKPTYDSVKGRYIKIGNAVMLETTIILTSLGGMSGQIQMRGFPYLPNDAGYASGLISEIKGKEGSIFGLTFQIPSYENKSWIANNQEKRYLNADDLKDDSIIYGMSITFSI